MHKKHLLSSLIVVFALVFSLGATAVSDTSSNTFNNTANKTSNTHFNNLLKQLDAIQKQHKVPAYAVIITSPKHILLDQVRGVSYAGSTTPVSQNAYFRIGSITKTFVSLATLAAQKQGKLKLTNKAKRYLDGKTYTNAHAQKHPVTIEQLLEHTGGFTDMGRKEFASNDVVTLTQGLKRFASARQVKWQPGQLHSYSNTGYGLAGRILELATNSTINDWLTRTVFKPLAMNSATMEYNKTVKTHLIPGYQADGITPIPYWNMIYPSLGAINLQPRDMAKLLQLYLSINAKTAIGGFDEQQIRRQETPKTTLAAKQGLNYGYGLGLYQWYSHKQLFYGHGGDADGYLAQSGYQKTAKLGYFVVINSFNKRAKRAMQRAIEGFIADKLPPQNMIPAAAKVDLSALAGAYYTAANRFGSRSEQPALWLKYSNNQLYISQSIDDWDPLVHTGNGLFRRTFEPAPTTAIFVDNGQYWFQGDEGNFIKR